MIVKNKYFEHLKSIIDVLPDSPGVYQYFNSEGKIIYVGKAKKLKRRVTSYFVKNHDNRKTELLVKNIADLKFIVVETEEDALLLENNLIKKYQPKYNVLLKDDKTYPWICIKNEPFPRVFQTRNVIRDGSLYFGPYTSSYLVKNLLELIHSLYKIRSCNLKLDKESIEKNKFKVCLEYHIGNCLGPCENYQSDEDYLKTIGEIKNILKGNFQSVINYLKNEMIRLSEEYRFEEALDFKNKVDILDNYKAKSTVVSPQITNVDVFSIDLDDQYAYVNFLRVVDGAIIQVFTQEIKRKLDETSKELLLLGITEIKQKFFPSSREYILPFKLNYAFNNIKQIVPQRGDKLKLLELSQRNAKYYRLEKLKQIEKSNPASGLDRILSTMKKDLQLKDLPIHIECFDNSNLQGTNPVASCVVFKNAKPSKRDYRHYNIKTVVGADDFASMEEIVFRRYRRLLDEKSSLPNLIVVDGGKGQLGSALTALEKLDLRGKIPIIGIAKRLEEIYFPGDSCPLYLDKNSETLKVIQQIRDEAHRFGITFHRNKRSKSFIKSELSSIEGIGNNTIEVLLKKYKSVENIKSVDLESLILEIGTHRGKLLYEYFHPK